MTRERIEALVVRERPGWRVVEGDDDRVTLLVSTDGRVVGERRWPARPAVVYTISGEPTSGRRH